MKTENDFIWVKCTILDKEKKSGFFTDKYSIVIRIEDDRLLSKNTLKVKAGIESFYNCEIGESKNIKFYEKQNGNYTPYKEYQNEY